MASKSQAWEAFATATGGSAATYAKADRSLIAYNRSSPGSSGGGRAVKPVKAPYLASLIIASGSPFPSSAGADVSDAYACDYRVSAYSITDPEMTSADVTPNPFQFEDLVGVVCAEYLAKVIEQVAVCDTHEIDGRRIVFEHSSLRIDFAPFKAQMDWQLAGGVGLSHYFISQRELEALYHLPPEEAARQMSRVRRSVRLSALLLLTAAELLTDTRSKQGSKLPFSGPEGASASASSENEKTPTLPGAGASTRHESRPRANAADNNQPHAATGPSNSQEGTEVPTSVQSHSIARVRRPFLSRKDALHHAQTAPL